MNGIYQLYMLCAGMFPSARFKNYIAGTSIYSPRGNEICVMQETVDIKIQRVVNENAGKIKKTIQTAASYIAAINEFICTA